MLSSADDAERDAGAPFCWTTALGFELGEMWATYDTDQIRAGYDMPLISTLRTRIKRLVRRTICFAKTERMHDLVLRLFINRDEFGRAI